MKTDNYYIEKSQLENFTKNAERIYNIIVVVCYFCNAQPEIEELSNITPILNHLRIEADNLYADLLNLTV